MKPRVPSRMTQSSGLIVADGSSRGVGPASEQVREESVRARDAGGELPEEAEARVDEAPLAVVARDQAAVQGLLARIVPRDQGRVLGIELAGEVEAALLHPAFEVGRAELVG